MKHGKCKHGVQLSTGKKYNCIDCGNEKLAQQNHPQHTEKMISLYSKQMAIVSLEMLKHYNEEMNKPQVAIPSFQDWLKSIVKEA